MPVVSARFQQDDARCGVFGQASRHDAAGGSRADDDEVGVDRILLRGHSCFPQFKCHCEARSERGKPSRSWPHRFRGIASSLHSSQ